MVKKKSLNASKNKLINSAKNKKCFYLTFVMLVNISKNINQYSH